MPKAGASLCSMRSRRLAPSDKYVRPSSDSGMYLRLSNGCAGTQGLASTDQFSFQRLKFSAGRAGQAGASSSAAAAAAAPAAVTATPDNSSEHGQRAQRRRGGDVLFFNIVDLGDVTAGEFDDGGVAAGQRVAGRQHGGAGSRGLGQCGVDVGDLVAGALAAVRIRQLAVGDEQRHLAEARFQFDLAEGGAWQADLSAVRLGVVGDDFTVREGDEIMDQFVGRVARNK